MRIQRSERTVHECRTSRATQSLKGECNSLLETSAYFLPNVLYLFATFEWVSSPLTHADAMKQKTLYLVSRGSKHTGSYCNRYLPSASILQIVLKQDEILSKSHFQLFYKCLYHSLLRCVKAVCKVVVLQKGQEYLLDIHFSRSCLYVPSK